MTDYSDARYWAISSIGYGKGFTAHEALDNYVATQMRNYDASTTVFETKPKWKEALTSGEAAPDLFLAPEGFNGFSIGMGSWWTSEAGRQEFSAEDRVTCSACGSTATHHVAEVSRNGRCVA